MVLFYLRLSALHSTKAEENHKEGRLQSDSIIAIVYAAMCIEAFLNEAVEHTFSREELEDFDRLRGKFRRSGKLPVIVKKIIILFRAAFDAEVPHSLTSSLKEVIELRNNLVHYKLSETATKIIYPPMKQEKLESGELWTSVDFTQTPKRVIAPFVQRVTGAAARKSYETAARVLGYWNDQAGENNGE